MEPMNLISLTTDGPSSINITANGIGVTMSFNNVEKFIFNDGKRSLMELQDMANITTMPATGGSPMNPGDVDLMA